MKWIQFLEAVGLSWMTRTASKEKLKFIKEIAPGFLQNAQSSEEVKQDKNFVTHKFKEYIRAAALPEHYALHSLRHTYATYLRQKGVPLDIIFRLLGHSSPAVTSEHYDHTNATHFRNQADLVDFEGKNA